MKQKYFKITDTLTDLPLDKVAFSKTEVGMKDIVFRALSSLTSKLRVPIILKDIKEFSYDEIAQIMNVDIGTVKSRIARGRQHLRNVLEPKLK